MAGIKFLVGDEAYAELIRASKAYALEMSAKILAGETLNEIQRDNIAEMLRVFAEGMSESPPRGPGQPPRIDPGSVAMSFAILRIHKKMGVNKAHEELAGRFGVSVTAIKESLKKYGPAAIRLAGGMKPRGRKPIR